MTFFTTNKIIVLSLILIIGLAIIAYNRKWPEGYANAETMYSDYMKRIDPTIRIINYFSGKRVKLCVTQSKDFGSIWATDGYTRTPDKQMGTYSGSKIAAAKAEELEKKLTNGFNTIKTPNMTKQQFDEATNKLILEVTTELRNSIGSTYDVEVAKLDFSDVVVVDKTPFIAKIAYLHGMGGIGDAKMTELYNMIWDSSTTADAIEASLKALGLVDYDLKMRVYNEVAFFNKSGDLTDVKVAEIYASIKADSSTAGLYKIVNNYLTVIPSYTDKVKNMSSGETTKQAYNANVVDVTYHDSADKLKSKDDTEIMVKDASGNMVKLPWDKAVTTTPRYNDPSYFRYSPSPYVPNYEDSVYLSRLTSYNDNAPVVDFGKQLPASAIGFCDANKTNPVEIEKQCGKMDKSACASTSCCVLLGGSKCVAGNQSGPTMKANYSDITLLNKDYYYYQGKCYGNCPP
jgi:hypothetical protein